MFQKSILVPGRVIIFGAIWAQTPFFGLLYLKWYDDEIWYVGTIMYTTETPDFLYEKWGWGATIETLSMSLCL